MDEVLKENDLSDEERKKREIKVDRQDAVRFTFSEMETVSKQIAEYEKKHPEFTRAFKRIVNYLEHF